MEGVLGATEKAGVGFEPTTQDIASSAVTTSQKSPAVQTHNTFSVPKRFEADRVPPISNLRLLRIPRIPTQEI